MKCQKCNNEAIINHAGGNQFYYCRICKVEVHKEPEILCGKYFPEAVRHGDTQNTSLVYSTPKDWSDAYKFIDLLTNKGLQGVDDALKYIRGSKK